MYPGGNLIKLSPTDLSAAAYTEGDIIFAKAELKNAVPSRGGCSILRNVTAFVEGAVTADDLTLLFFDNNQQQTQLQILQLMNSGLHLVLVNYILMVEQVLQVLLMDCYIAMKEHKILPI